MGDTWVTDMRHYVDEEGVLAELPSSVLPLALFHGSVMAWVTSHEPGRGPTTNVYCRRSPGRRRCRGEIRAVLDDSSGRIVWECPVCGDHGYIHGWEGTEWDRRRPAG